VTTVILIRHAHSVANDKGVLAGRAPGITLSKKGFSQAQDLKNRLGNLKIREIRISPLERCHLTMQPWLDEQIITASKIVVDPDISEVDYGTWTGKKLSTLALKKEWRVVQKTPSKMIFPDGESLLDVQTRATRALMKSVKQRGNGVSIIVSHGDVIKSIIASALDLELDKFQKIVIDPASISVLQFNKNDFRLLHLNDSASSFEYLSNESRSIKAQVGGGAGRR
jgi:probable phosphomutase (TIGR03848 family)